jgi:glycosyl transferase family 2
VSAVPQPAVSIVIATYNRRSWLRLAIESVLAQDYPDLELLVMDDGSTDETPELLADYARRNPPERFRFERHENMGQARTLNRGWELARGEVLGYLSDDDLLAPDAVTRLVAELEAPELVAAYPGHRIIDAEGRVIDSIRPIAYSPREAFRMLDTVIGPGCLARREPLESTGGWDPELRFMGDFILWIKLGLSGPIARVPEPLASWRRHGEAQSVRIAADHGRELLALVGVAAQLLELPPDAFADRAEALRNACIQAAFFGGDAASMGERFLSVDLLGAQTSAMAAGLQLDEMPDERADRTVGAWRELAAVTMELSRARGSDPIPVDRSSGPGAGLEAAMARLRRAGALPDEGGGADGWERAGIGAELMRAAIDCGADADLGASRCLLIERSAGVEDAEFDQLIRLGYRATPERLGAVIEDRRRKLEQLQLSRTGDR